MIYFIHQLGSWQMDRFFQPVIFDLEIEAAVGGGGGGVGGKANNIYPLAPAHSSFFTIAHHLGTLLAIKIKDGGHNFRSEDAEHSPVKITPAPPPHHYYVLVDRQVLIFQTD